MYVFSVVCRFTSYSYSMLKAADDHTNGGGELTVKASDVDAMTLEGHLPPPLLGDE